MSTIVKKYIKLVKSIPDIIEVSGYRHDYIARKLGLNPQSFSSKKQRNTWSPDEIEKLLFIIRNEDVQEFLDEQLHEASLAGDTVSSEEFEKIMGW